MWGSRVVSGKHDRRRKDYVEGSRGEKSDGAETTRITGDKRVSDG